MTKRTKVAVIGMADGPEAVEGASVLACLDPARFERFAVLCHENESGALRPGCCDRVLLLPPLHTPGFVSALVDAIRAEGLDVLLPGSALAASLLVHAGAALERTGIHSSSLGSEGTNFDEVQDAPLTPRRRLPTIASLASFAGPWPLLLQSSCGARRMAGDPWEALRAHEALQRAILSRGANETIDAINWAAHSSLEVALVLDEGQGLLGASAVRVLADDDRLRPWMAVTIEHEQLIRVAARAAGDLDLRGPSRYLFKLDEAGFSLADARAGFPLWIEVTRAGGPPLVELAVRAALGDELARPESIYSTPAGVLFSQTAEDAVFLGGTSQTP